MSCICRDVVFVLKSGTIHGKFTVAVILQMTHIAQKDKQYYANEMIRLTILLLFVDTCHTMLCLNHRQEHACPLMTSLLMTLPLCFEQRDFSVEHKSQFEFLEKKASD